jgi:hypothetical protein
MTDLNHPTVKPLTLDAAIALALEPEFVAFVFAESRPPCFDYWVESYDRGWTCFVPDQVEVAYPLWSTNADQTLVCVGQKRLWFMQGHHDDPDTYDIAETVQGLLADLFIKLYESEATIEDLRNAATSCGFRHVDDVIAFAESSGENYYDRKSDLIARIDGMAELGRPS